jgi:glycosyltransferase involved in cell wall biosynthesis
MPNRIPVLQIIKSLGRGGAEMLLAETLKLHDQEKFNFHYMYFLPWKDQLVPQLKANGGKVICMGGNNNIQLFMKAGAVARYVKKNKIQLIHAHLPWAGILARLVGILTGIPVIYTEHNKQERYHFLTRMINLNTMDSLKVVVPVSRDVEESIRKFKPKVKASVITILNGVNVDHFKPASKDDGKIRNQFNIPQEATVIATIGVFRFQKRFDLWLDIANEIVRVKSDVRFIIVGDGPLKDQILARRKELNLEAHVHMAGLQTDVRPYLAAADIYMMSSVFEGLPIALLEAMACGLPVISTDAGGIKEVVRHENEGLLCSVNEPKKLTDLALRLVTDMPLRKKLAFNARIRIVNDFSMRKMVDELEILYQQFVTVR